MDLDAAHGGGASGHYYHLGEIAFDYVSRASDLGAMLAARVPSLINLSGTNFDENTPLRNQPPVINTVAGAVEIQEVLDNLEWVGLGGDVR